MIVVKLTTEFPQIDLENLTPQRSSQWGDCRFVIDQEIETCDYWMVIDGLLLPESTLCPPENVFLFTGEPPSIRHYSRRFLGQFASVFTCQRQIRHPQAVYGPPPLPWYVNLTYDDVITRPIVKTDSLMMMTSNKQMTAGHKQRYQFARRLKAYFGDQIQLSGRGIQDVDDKWTVLAPCRYAVAVENSRNLDYFSEKLTDCFLTETFPFYDGCPNISQYFPEAAMQTIDIDDFQGTVAAIERVLSDPLHYERHLAALRQAKAVYLQRYSLFALLSRPALPQQHTPRRRVTLEPERRHFLPTGWRSRTKSVLRLLASL